MQLAAAGADVTAVEINPKRLVRLRQNLERTGLRAELVEADVMKWAPARQFDHVLLDAPCSATGIFRRHPDVLHRVRPSDIADLARVQAGLLRRAAAWAKPGGLFIFFVWLLEIGSGSWWGRVCQDV